MFVHALQHSTCRRVRRMPRHRGMVSATRLGFGSTMETEGNEDKYRCILIFTERAIHRCQRGKITLVDSVPPWSFREVPGVLEYGSCCSGDCAQVCHRRVVAEYRLRIDKQERVSTFKAQVAAKALWIDTPPPPYLSLIICNDS